MSCNCKTQVEQRLTEHFSNKLVDSKDVEARLTGYALCLEGNTLNARPGMGVEVHHTVTTKKTGAEKRKVGKSTMTFSFCPFCGVALNPEQAAQRAASTTQGEGA